MIMAHFSFSVNNWNVKIVMDMKKVFLLLYLLLLIASTSYSQPEMKYLKRGSEKMEQQEYKGAIDAFDKAIAINPNHAMAYCSRGIAKGELQDLPGELADYNKAIAIDSTCAVAYYNRGCAKHDHQDFDGAIKDYSKAIELRPKDGDAYANRGAAKIALGLIDSGCWDMKIAKEFGNTDAEEVMREYCH